MKKNNYVIQVYKSNNSGEYESGIEQIELNECTQDEALEELKSYGKDVPGYSKGNSGSPLFTYQFVLFELDPNENVVPYPNQHFVKSVYSDNY